MSFKDKIKVCVIGATGYTGLDLILLLSKHPKVKILNLCASKNLGKKIHFFPLSFEAFGSSSLTGGLRPKDTTALVENRIPIADTRA